MKKKRLIPLLVLVLILLCGFDLYIWNLAQSATADKNAAADFPATEATSVEAPAETVGCDHSWLDADCETSKTCSHCGQTDGNPLGHDWAYAACMAPETCRRCGEISGTVPDHSWADANCVMPKTCTVCGTTDGKSSDRNNSESHAFGSWETSSSSIFRTCSLCGIRDEAGTITSKYYDQAADVLSRSWIDGGYPPNPHCALDFSRDGSFSGNLDGEVSGTWELMLACSSCDSATDSPTGCLTLHYTQNGKAHASSVRVVFSPDGDNWENAQFRTYLYLAEYGIKFKCAEVEPESDTAPQVTPEEAAKKILGTWNSILYTGKSIYPEETWRKMSLDYTVEFFDNGTFRAHLDEKFSGTWEVGSVIYDDLMYYSCTANDDRFALTVSLNKEELTLQLSSEEKGYPSYVFRKMDPQTLRERQSMLDEAAPLPLGSWVSHTIVTEARDLQYSEAFTHHQATLRSDGTLRLTVDSPGSDEPRILEFNWHLAAITPTETGNLYHIDVEDASYIRLYFRNNELYITYLDDTPDDEVYREIIAFRKA